MFGQTDVSSASHQHFFLALFIEDNDRANLSRYNATILTTQPLDHRRTRESTTTSKSGC